MKCILHVITLVLHRFGTDGAIRMSDQGLIDEIPTSLNEALNSLGLTSNLDTYAVCTACDYLHPPSFKLGSSKPSYPSICGHSPFPGSPACQNRITDNFSDIPDLEPQPPIKYFKYHRLRDYIAGLLSQPNIEETVDQTIDEAFANCSQKPNQMRSFWDGEFIKNFKGPGGEKLFLDRGEETRILFALNVDFFNVNMVLRRNASTSCGIISMACLNLPVDIRYKPEFMYLAAVIPGPHEPQHNAINHYLRPLIDELLQFWEPGVKFSRTALSDSGKVVRCAIAICVCDLPAARKVAGLAGPTSHHYCSRCGCCERDTLGRTDTDHSDWKPRNNSKLLEAANSWNAAVTEIFQTKIFQTYGTKWSELWRLPSWQPSQQLVTDPMHCLFGNLAQNHFRDYLGLTYLSAANGEKSARHPAFTFEFEDYNNSTINNFLAVTHAEVDQETIQVPHAAEQVRSILDGCSEELSVAKLQKLYLSSLKSAAQELKVTVVEKPTSSRSANTTKSRTLTKEDYAYSFIEWVSVF